MGSSGERRTPQFRHARLATPELAGLELAFLDLLRQLDSTNDDCRVVESFEPEHRPSPLFDSPVVLFNEVVQVLAGSDSHSFGKFARLLHFPHRAMRCRIGVQGDLRWFACFLYRPAEKSLCRIHIAIFTQEEVDGPAGLVHGPIQVDPAPSNL